MEEINSLTEHTADQMLDLFQQFTLNRPRLIPSEYMTRLHQLLERSTHGSGERFFNYPLLLKTFTILARRKESPTMSELSTELDTPLSSATRFVDYLVRVDLLERIDDPEDRRLVRVRMTEYGKQIYQAGITNYKLLLLKVLSTFSPSEQMQFISLLNKFLNAFPTEWR
jgi:DNA-binding MarR family transcriptional regulator